MAEGLIEQKKQENNMQYTMRRIMLALAIALIVVILVIAVTLLSPEKPVFEPVVNETDEPEPLDWSSLFVYPEQNTTVNETVEQPLINETVEDECIVSPLEALGCLETYTNKENQIFGVYGLNIDDRNVERTLDRVEDECTNKPNFVECVINTAVYESENSWVCEWECLEDVHSCEIYKMHLAVQVARQFLAPTDVFVARTENFNFYIIYNDGNAWVSAFKFTTSPTTALYNDVYYSGEKIEVIWPEIKTVDAGDDFCFDVYADDSCVCAVEVQTFSVGDCPQLPADMKGICDEPVSEVYLSPGKNRVCFEVSEDAEEEFYTYNFAFTSGEDFLPTGNAFIKKREFDCCVEGLSFKGFLSVE